MSSDVCARCGVTVETVETAPAAGVTFRTRVTQYSVMRLSRIRWIWLRRDSRYRVDGSFTDFTLCQSCAGEVLDFAQGRR